MENTPERIELVRAVVFAVIERHFPEELNLLPVVWHAWQVSCERPHSKWETALGLPALGREERPSNRTTVILLVDAIVPESLAPDWSPSRSEIDRAGRELARLLGLHDAQLERVTLAVEPELRAHLDHRRDRGPRGAGEDPVEKSFWVQRALDDFVSPTEPFTLDALKELILAASDQLLVDEHNRKFWCCGQSHKFTDFSPTAQKAIWLSLTHTGGSFSYSEIASVSHLEERDEGNLQKYPHAARAAFQKLLDRDIIASGKQGTYYIDPAWSWTWVRVNEDARRSRLL